MDGLFVLFRYSQTGSINSGSFDANYEVCLGSRMSAPWVTLGVYDPSEWLRA